MRHSTNTAQRPSPVAGDPDVRARPARSNVKASYRAWSRVAAKTNVRRITLADLAARSRELYEGGAITLEDHALLSLMPGRGGGDERRVPPPIGIRSAPDRPRDFLLYWQHQLAVQKGGYAPAEQLERTQRVLDILNYLESLRTAAT